MRRDLAHGIGAARLEGRALVLRRRRRAEHLGGARLVIAELATGMGDMVAHGLEQAQRAERDDIGGVFRKLEAKP